MNEKKNKKKAAPWPDSMTKREGWQRRPSEMDNDKAAQSPKQKVFRGSNPLASKQVCLASLKLNGWGRDRVD